MIRLVTSLLFVMSYGFAADDTREAQNEKLYAAVVRIKSGEADLGETLMRFKEASACLPSISVDSLDKLLVSDPPMTTRDALSSLSAEWKVFQDAFKDDAPKRNESKEATAEIAALRPILLKEFLRLGMADTAKPKVGDLGAVVLVLEQNVKKEESQKIIALVKEWVDLLDAGKDEDFIERSLLDGLRFKNEDAASKATALKSFNKKRDEILAILRGLVASTDSAFSKESAKVISIRFTGDGKRREVILAVGGNADSYRISSFK